MDDWRSKTVKKLGPVSISDKTSVWKVSWSLKAAGFVFRLFRSLCQIPRWCDKLNYQYGSFETSRDLTVRHLHGYGNRALDMTLYLQLDVFYEIVDINRTICSARLYCVDKICRLTSLKTQKQEDSDETALFFMIDRYQNNLIVIQLRSLLVREMEMR